jgi:meiotically up-regulated gene 157 (Mug157) protein
MCCLWKVIIQAQSTSCLVWSLAETVQGLTSSDPYEQAGLLQVLLRMQCGNGWMHESVHVSHRYS